MTLKARAGGLLLAGGVVGVVAAHVAAYVIAIPDDTRRAHYLAATGHAYWPIAVGLGLLAGCVAIVGSGLRGRNRAMAGMGLSRGHRVQELAAVTASQAGLFTLMEVSERIGAGSPAMELVRSPAFLVGLGIQVLVALVVVSILAGIEHGVHRLVAAGMREVRRTYLLRPSGPGRLWAMTAWTGSNTEARGPPLSAFC